jgi:hypothetical protein
VLSSAWDFLILGLLPLGAACFPGWVFVKSLPAAPGTQRWSLVGIVILGLVLMIVAWFMLRSAFFSIQRESDSRPRH